MKPTTPRLAEYSLQDAQYCASYTQRLLMTDTGKIGYVHDFMRRFMRRMHRDGIPAFLIDPGDKPVIDRQDAIRQMHGSGFLHPYHSVLGNNLNDQQWQAFDSVARHVAHNGNNYLKIEILPDPQGRLYRIWR